VAAVLISLNHTQSLEVNSNFHPSNAIEQNEQKITYVAKLQRGMGKSKHENQGGRRIAQIPKTRLYGTMIQSRSVLIFDRQNVKTFNVR
jgi:hypothetical protein